MPCPIKTVTLFSTPLKGGLNSTDLYQQQISERRETFEALSSITEK